MDKKHSLLILNPGDFPSFSSSNAKLSDCGVKSNNNNKRTALLWSFNQIKFITLTLLDLTLLWCHLSLAVTLACLLKSTGVSQKNKTTFSFSKKHYDCFHYTGFATKLPPCWEGLSIGTHKQAKAFSFAISVERSKKKTKKES